MFYDRLKALCEKRGTTVTALAKEMGLSTSIPSAWKKGRMPRIDQIQKIAEHLKCSEYDLMGEPQLYPTEPETKNPPAEAGGVGVNPDEYPEYIKRCVETALRIPPDRREEFLRVAQEIAKTFEPRK